MLITYMDFEIVTNYNQSTFSIFSYYLYVAFTILGGSKGCSLNLTIIAPSLCECILRKKVFICIIYSRQDNQRQIHYVTLLHE